MKKRLAAAAAVVALLAIPGSLAHGSGTKPAAEPVPPRPKTLPAGAIDQSPSPEPFAATGQQFVSIVPFRAYDSRNDPAGPIIGGEEAVIDVLTDEEGNGVLPLETTAITFNVTVTATNGLGLLSLYPADANYPGISTINWMGSGVTLANGGVVSVSEGAEPGYVSVLAQGNTATEFIIDVTGYYLPITP
jgi:hypothetical protein